MPELAYSDLPAATRSRFTTDAEAQAAIDAVVAAARRYCGWHVSPVREGDVVVVDSDGGVDLPLPTMHLSSVTAVDEDGQDVSPAGLRWSRLGALRKRSGARWAAGYGAVTVTMTHGFTEAEAADWRAAIFKAVGDRITTASVRDDPQMARKRVDDVEYQWFATLLSADELLAAEFSSFRILPGP